jgi:hypothetical protein
MSNEIVHFSQQPFAAAFLIILIVSIMFASTGNTDGGWIAGVIFTCFSFMGLMVIYFRKS